MNLPTPPRNGDEAPKPRPPVKSEPVADESVIALFESLNDPTCEFVHPRPQSLSLMGERNAPTCGDPAVWIMLMSCGCHTYMCAPHQTRARALVLANKGGWTCNHAGNAVRIEIEWKLVR